VVRKVAVPFAAIEARVTEAVLAEGLIVVNRASASDGAKGRGLTIPGDVVLGVFRNDFALRMLAANREAGLEAPIRLHLVEESDGTTTLRYRTPSAVFAPYPSETLKGMALELDGIFATIVARVATP